MSTALAPACSRAFLGSVISACSKSSVSRIATRMPSNLLPCILKSLLFYVLRLEHKGVFVIYRYTNRQDDWLLKYTKHSRTVIPVQRLVQRYPIEQRA